MKYILIIFVLLTGPQLSPAQTHTQEQLKRNTQKELAAVIDSSKAVIGLAVVDLTTQETTFMVHGKMILPQASAIKIPILMEVYKQAYAGRFSITSQLLITSAEKVGGSGILQQLQDTVSMSIRDLCILMMTQSDNTATNALLNLAGISNINETLKEEGFTATRVQRKMMDVTASAKGIENTSTPAEAVAILNLLYQGRFINKEVSDQVLTVLKKTARQGSRIAAGLPPQVPVAYKPGGLPRISTEWAIVYLSKRPYAIVIMEKDKIPGDATRTMERLSRIVYNYFVRMAD
jgi:beta-lactamase class A